MNGWNIKLYKLQSHIKYFTVGILFIYYSYTKRTDSKTYIPIDTYT